ncbi:MAG: iron-containing alcohol dehydrogenase [Myxococcales bacterium]|nr:iron-containing alcohol dehydrogenase [Myxococcales bacterium]
MKSIPSFYEFFCPVKIICGHKALSHLPYEMELLGVRRALVVTDQGVQAAGLLPLVEKAMRGSHCAVGATYDQTPVDSSNHVVNDVAALFRRQNCDCFVAVGGGSVIDTAKGANIVISEGTDDLMKFQGMDRLTAKMRPLIVVPTTAGTGSEATCVAVIKDVDKKVKMPFVDDRLYPHLAIIDSHMTKTMPPKITAATGMDALTHAVEAYCNLQKNPLSDALAIAAIEIVFEYLPTAVHKGADKTARLAMANAALMAGVAFSNSMVGVVHALAHATGAVARVPHGVANSIFLPYGMEYNLPKTIASMADLVGPMAVKYPAAEPRERAREAIQAVRMLRGRLHDMCGLPLTLSEAGVGRDQLEVIARTAVNDGSANYNPVELTYEDALFLLQQSF